MWNDPGRIMLPLPPEGGVNAALNYTGRHPNIKSRWCDVELKQSGPRRRGDLPQESGVGNKRWNAFVRWLISEIWLQHLGWRRCLYYTIKLPKEEHGCSCHLPFQELLNCLLRLTVRGWTLREKATCRCEPFQRWISSRQVFVSWLSGSFSQVIRLFASKEHCPNGWFHSTGARVTPAAFLLIYQLCASVATATRPRCAAYSQCVFIFKPIKMLESGKLRIWEL